MLKQEKDSFTFLLRQWLFCLFFLVSSNFISAQTSPEIISPSSQKAIDAEFLQKEVELNKGDIVSNVIRVVNNSSEPVSFTLDLNQPLNWRVFNKSDKYYTVSANDSIFIPVRVIPNSSLKGNSHYIISAFLISEEGAQLANAFFFSFSKKVVKWELSISPRERIYFLNDQKTAPFNVDLLNSGNENQDILVTFTEIGNNIILSDSSEKIITKRFFDINLNPGMDTTLQFNMSYFDGKRNFKRVDNENYRPKSLLEEKKYSLYVKSNEAKQTSRGSFTNNKKVDFIKLSDQKKVNPYGSAVIPLIAEANVYNLIGNQPIMNLILRGNSLLPNGANLVYFTQFNYVSYNFNRQLLNDNFFFVGYFHKKGDVQIGNVTGSGSVGIPIFGKGISANYHINKQHTVGGFFTRSRGFFNNPDKTAFGLSHRFTFKNKKQLASSFGRVINSGLNTTTDYFSSRYAFNITRNHQFGIGGTGTRNVINSDTLPTVTRMGYLVNMNYGGTYLDNKLNTNWRVSYNSQYFATGFSKRFSVLNRSMYRFTNRRMLILQNDYNQYEAPFYQNNTLTVVKNMTFNNQLFYSFNSSTNRTMPSIFYNISNVFTTRLHYRGVGLDYNFFDMEKNLRFAASVRGGYNDLLDYPEIKEYFTLQLFTLLQYQNFSLNARYNYGPQSVRNVNTILDNSRYPQLIYLSLQHQYVFSDTRFILQTNANYSYFNQIYNHSFGLFPEIFYYSYSGWRLKLNVGYNLNSSNRGKAGLYGQNPLPVIEEDPSANVSQSFIVGAGIRKEFGIPIPNRFSKQRFYDVEFVAFLDVNGNKIKDKEEALLENIIVRVGTNEVLTNADGAAKLMNVEQGEYPLIIIPLVELNGWFAHVDDSIIIDNIKKRYIPFVRGVKLQGDVILHREQYSGNGDMTIDLSRIRITATDSTGKALSTLTGFKGGFSFYVPYGKYILTMDESLLGDQFTLVQNNIPIELKDGMEKLYSSFYIIERKRKIIKKSFNGNGEVKKSKVESPLPNKEKEETPAPPGNQLPPEEPKQEEKPEEKKPEIEFRGSNDQNKEDDYDYGDMSNIRELDSLVDILLSKTKPKTALTASDLEKIEGGKIKKNNLSKYGDQVLYTIQVGAFAKGDIPADVLAKLVKLGEVESYRDENGLTKYFLGTYNSLEETAKAKKDISKAGFKDAFVIGINKGKLITAKEATELKGK